MKKRHLFYWMGIAKMLCLSLLLSGCRGSSLWDQIRELSWEGESVVFNYEYYTKSSASMLLASSSLPSRFSLNIYQVAMDRLPGQPLEAPRLMPPENILSLSRAVSNYMLKNNKTDSPIFRVASYQPETGLILLLFLPESYLGETAFSYRVIDTSTKTYRKMTYDHKALPPENIIRWTGFENQVLVHYKKDDVMYYGVSEIDLNTLELQDIHVFKQYAANGRDLSWEYPSGVEDETQEVKILGFENKHSVYYLEKPAHSQQVYLFKQDLNSGTLLKRASLDKDTSYYPHLRQYSEVSIPHKKVAYKTYAPEGEQFIYVANLDGSEERLLVSRKRDLPLGEPIPLGVGP